MKVAISGMRHNHVCSIVNGVQKHPRLELAGVAEEDPGACRDIVQKAGVEVTHSSLGALLEEVDCDIVALGGVFGRRGAEAVRALEAGKHVLSDKPLCTRLDELDRIEELSKARRLSVVAQLTMRYVTAWRVARRAVLGGEIGEVATVSVFGRHGLQYREGRPDWFFEEGQHGGTINDILVHGLDSVEWMTGLRVAEIVAARSWNQLLGQVPHFQDCAQAMLRLSNGAGVLMDGSYSAPAGHSDGWTLRLNGTEGDLSASSSGPVTLRRNKEEARELPLDIPMDRFYLDDLLADIEGGEQGQLLSTQATLRATRVALLAQRTADEGSARVRVPE